MTRKPIVLGNSREFRSQQAAEDHFRNILRLYPDGGLVNDPAHHSDLAALLERYDDMITSEPEPKIGPGIDHFERRLNVGPGYATPSFWVARTDGSATDFSFYTAIRGEPKPRAQEFSDACRAAVAGDLAEAKRRHFALHADESGRVACELTGELISVEAAHLDHAYPTFGQIVVMFRAAQGWHEKIPDGVLTAPADRQTTTRFLDPALAEKFRQFHHRGALLRVVSKAANLSLAAKQRVPTVARKVLI
jgi:hypothetical protein